MSEHDQEKSPPNVREYEKPEVETEEVFETLALACVKADTQCAPAPGGTVLQS